MSTLIQQLQRKAESAMGSHIAVVEEDTRWTYAEFLADIRALAGGLRELGVQPGENVALMLYNQKEFLVAFFALRLLGAVVVPINIQMLPQDIGYVLRHAEIRRILVAPDLAPLLAGAPLQRILVGPEQAEEGPTYAQLLASGQANPVMTSPSADAAEELAFLLYTSGTSGSPKGVMLSEHNVLANMDGFRQVVPFDTQDRLLLALPLFHSYGLIIAMTGLLFGGTLALVPRFQPKQILQAMVTEQVTILPLVPTLYAVILQLLQKNMPAEGFPHLRFCISGGASLPASLLKQIESVLHTTVLEGYGLTETSPVLAVNDPAVGSIPHCVGKPLPNVSMRILHDDGTPVAPGEEGEVVVQGENVMLGYYHLPEETQAVLCEDGWLKTGDLGHLDAAGRLFITGRKKDLIIKAGENISPRPVEEVLYQHPGIQEAAVIGLPHEKLGEIIVACVSPKEGQALAESEILAFCRQQLPPTYQPDKIVILETLPKTASGKIIKKLLRQNLSPTPAG